MKPLLLVLIAIATAAPLMAQEPLFRLLEAERTSVRVRSQVEKAPYTWRVKDLRIVVTPGFSVEWTDNVQLTEQSPESDLLLTPRLDLHAFHPLGEANLISLDVGMGYSKYIDHEELDRLTITPETALGFDLLIKDFSFNFHERLSYELDPTLHGAVSGTAEYGGIDNTAGVFGTWKLNKVSANLAYDFVRFISSSPQYERLDRSSHQILARSGVQIHPSMVVGVEATASHTVYDISVQNDYVAYSAGGYMQWQVTEQLAVSPRGGYSLYLFSPNDAGFDPGEYDAYYFGLSLDHRPNQTLSYQLTVNREINPGIEANLSDVWRIELNTTWGFIRDLPLLATLFYEHGKEAAGLQAEIYDRVGGNLGLNYQLTSRANVSLLYGLVTKDSDLAGRDYMQNRVTLTLGYRL